MKRFWQMSSKPVLEFRRDLPIDYADALRKLRRTVTRHSNATVYALWFFLFGLAAEPAGPSTAQYFV